MTKAWKVTLIVLCALLSFAFFFPRPDPPQSVLVSTAAEPSPEANDEATETKRLGTFRLTVYAPESDGGKWGYQTATGVRSEHLSTCAVDPDVIPYGTVIIIGDPEDGLRLRAVDCGSAVNGKHIDIFYDGTEREACGWLTNTYGDYAEVYIEGEN